MSEPASGRVQISPIRACGREGCARRRGKDGYCSLLCSEIDRRLTRTRVLIAEKGISPAAAELWAAAVSLSDQLSEVHRLETHLKSAVAALQSGVGNRLSAR